MGMTDHDLLELAAKSAGYTVVDRDDDGTLYVHSSQDERGERWNPLADDGDALRLSCRLSISISHAERYVFASACRGLFESTADINGCGGRELAARRVITTCAAEIGRDQ